MYFIGQSAWPYMWHGITCIIKRVFQFKKIFFVLLDPRYVQHQIFALVVVICMPLKKVQLIFLVFNISLWMYSER